MKDTDQARSEAVSALLRTIQDFIAHEGIPSTTTLAQTAVDAIAQHALAVAHNHYTKQLGIDAVDQPDG